MAKDETKRIRPEVLQADVNSFLALQKVSGYNPANQEFTVAKGEQSNAEMKTAQADEVQVEAAYKTARDVANGKEWAFHNFVLGVKRQVAAQFGEDSNELQALGLKKKSEHKKPKRKTGEKK